MNASNVVPNLIGLYVTIGVMFIMIASYRKVSVSK